ncbi:unnamed protein product [Cercospora beticola]|nr:unnamed protein product [Cercospora beticola]
MIFNIHAVAILALGSSLALAAAIPDPEASIIDRNTLTRRIATNSYAACNCPNNCRHKAGSSCKYYGGVSDNSDVVSGHCVSLAGQLTCQA